MANPFDDEPHDATRQGQKAGKSGAGNSNIRRYNFFDEEENHTDARGAAHLGSKPGGNNMPSSAAVKTTTTTLRTSVASTTVYPISGLSRPPASNFTIAGENTSGYEGRQQSDAPQKSETERIWDEVESIQQRSLQSTQNSLRYIEDSEQAGFSTADALLKQREQLENVDRNLNTMDQSLNTAQKHINSLKSVFGGVKNYFAGKPAPLAPSGAAAKKPSSGSALRSVVDSQKQAETIADAEKVPGSWNKAGLYSDDNAGGRFPTKQNASSASSKTPAPPGSKNTFDLYEDRLNDNLDLMGAGVSRLKDLAKGLSTEIDEQNTVLDKINVRADQVGTKVAMQDKALGRILGKK